MMTFSVSGFSASNENTPSANQKVRRWYDTDPILLEVINLMALAKEEAKTYATKLINGVEAQVAPEVLAKVVARLEDPNRPQNRWYDKEPVLAKAMELLQLMPPEAQRVAALQFIDALKAKQSPAAYGILKEVFNLADAQAEEAELVKDEAQLG
ncbi:MAG: hypothetical protein NTW61_01860 [Candidatus Melainabacteria bacterium]|jgi:hypothetical protein|nr:hypothetical protein [Candidatus Melainabacteria bacterium]